MNLLKRCLRLIGVTSSTMSKETTQPAAKNLPAQQGPVSFNIYDKVRIKEGVAYLPTGLKPGDIGIIDGITYLPLGWVHVSFDSGANHGTSMKLEEIELVT